MKIWKSMMIGFLVCTTLLLPVHAQAEVQVEFNTTDKENQGSISIQGLPESNAFSLNLKVNGDANLKSFEVSPLLVEAGAKVNYRYDKTSKALDIYVTSKNKLNDGTKFELAKLNFTSESEASVSLTENKDKDELKYVQQSKSTILKNANGYNLRSDTLLLKGNEDEGETETPIEKPIVIKDSATGITITGKPGVLPEGTIAKVSKLEDKAKLAFIQEQMKLVSTKFTVYDISLWKDEVAIQPKDEQNVEVSVPIPSGYDREKLAVYFVDETTSVGHSVTITGDNIVFETNHFSNYVIAERNVENKVEDTPTDTQTPGGDTSKDTGGVSTGDTTSIAILLLFVIAGSFGVVKSMKVLAKHNK